MACISLSSAGSRAMSRKSFTGVHETHEPCEADQEAQFTCGQPAPFFWRRDRTGVAQARRQGRDVCPHKSSLLVRKHHDVH